MSLTEMQLDQLRQWLWTRANVNPDTLRSMPLETLVVCTLIVVHGLYVLREGTTKARDKTWKTLTLDLVTYPEALKVLRKEWSFLWDEPQVQE